MRMSILPICKSVYRADVFAWELEEDVYCQELELQSVISSQGFSA